MKLSVWTVLTYLIAIVKLLNTAIFFSGATSNFYYLTITSIVAFLGNSFYEKYAMVCLIGLIFIILVWLGGIISTLLGFKYKRKMYMLSVIIFFIANIFDLIAALTIKAIEMRVSCAIVSSIVLLICVISLKKEHKKTENRPKPLKKGDFEQSEHQKTGDGSLS